MDYTIAYYSEEVQEQIISLPDTLIGRRIVMLHSFIKKSNKTPQRELDIARGRSNEVRHANP